MQTHQFNCSTCANLGKPGKQTFGLTKGVFELTEHEWFAQCFGCGKLGIKIIDDSLTITSGI